MIGISSAEAERGLSSKKLICGKVRNSLKIICVRINGNTFIEERADWDATPFVKCCMDSSYREATDPIV
jgi:hypothetical protein